MSLVKQQTKRRCIFKFCKSIKSDVTKKVYEYNLGLFMEFCGIDKFEDLIGRQIRYSIFDVIEREKIIS